jgi:hypothetical protein
MADAGTTDNAMASTHELQRFRHPLLVTETDSRDIFLNLPGTSTAVLWLFWEICCGWAIGREKYAILGEKVRPG